MVDLGFIDPKFTWCHGSEAEQRRLARHDRALANGKWQQRFPEASATHCPHAYLDHCPLLLRTVLDRSRSMCSRPFRFEAAWISDRRFMEFTEANWNKSLPFHEAIEDFTTRVWRWNKEVFGDIKKTEEVAEKETWRYSEETGSLCNSRSFET